MIIKRKFFLSPVDWVFLVVVVCLFAFIFLYFRRENKAAVVTLKVTDQEPLYARSLPSNEYTTGFVVGDKEVDDLGKTVAEIKGVESYPESETDHVVYLTVKLDTVYNPRNNSYSYGGKKIIFGESLNFFFSKVKVRGLVVDFPGFMDMQNVVEKDITVKTQLKRNYPNFADTYGVPEYLANAVKVGDEVRDSRGRLLAKVLNIEIKPAARTVTTQNGQILQQQDPILKDVFYTLQLHVKHIGGVDYAFDFLPVVVDQRIPLNTKNTYVWPTITEIFP